jgi:hypothetical protein
VASIYYHKQNMERIVKWFWFLLLKLIDAVEAEIESQIEIYQKPSPKIANSKLIYVENDKIAWI